MTLKKRRIILGVSIMALFIIAPVVLFYSMGYRINENLQIVEVGGLYVSSPLRNTEIFINNKEKKTPGMLQNGIFLKNLKPGNYSILINKEGYYPWAKELAVKERLVTEAKAFLMPKEPKWESFSPDETNKEIVDALKKTSKTKNLVILTKDEKQNLWLDSSQNIIYTEWLAEGDLVPYYFCDSFGACDKKIAILNSKFNIRKIDFYPTRRDVIIAAVQNGIFVIEIDGRGTRNIQPIYKGKEPVFIIHKNDKTIYILDDGIFTKIELP